ncbi:MAG: hypothetical protein WBD87_08680 [Candidatus Acidiferrales bacterium]
MDGFYEPPGLKFEPGDIFFSIPFLALKYPLTFFRPRPREEGLADIFTPAQANPKDTDTAKGSLQHRSVILLSHGCELDGVQRDVEAKQATLERRYWLAAPVQPLSAVTSADLKERTRNGQQPTRFYLPPDQALADAEHYADLRRITPINVPYFLEANKAGNRKLTLTEPARLALQSHIGMFFSGLALYVQPVPCPHCGREVDPTLFKVPSTDDEE